MFPTAADLEFYESRNRPSWTATMKLPSCIGIHRVINSHVGRQNQPDNNHHTHNTILVLKMARRRGSLRQKLEEMSRNPGCCYPKQRAAMCKRWLRKMNRNWLNNLKESLNEDLPRS